MNRTYIGPDPTKDNWFFQIVVDPVYNSFHQTHFVHIEFGSALQRASVTFGCAVLKGDMPEAGGKFIEQTTKLFDKIKKPDALENSEAFCAMVEAYVKKNKMVLVTNGGRTYLHNQPFNFTFKHFGQTQIFQPDEVHLNSFGLTFSGRLTLDTPQPGYNHDPSEDLPTVLQLFTRVIRKKTVLHAQLARLSQNQIPNRPPAFQNVFQMEYK